MAEPILLGSASGAIVACLRVRNASFIERLSTGVIAAAVGHSLGPEIQLLVNESFNQSFGLLSVCFLSAVFSNDILMLATRAKNIFAERLKW